MNADDFLTDLDSDWNEENLRRLRASIAASYMMARDMTNPKLNPYFASPNHKYLQGYSRWFLLDSHLAKACQTGFIAGLEPYWVSFDNAAGRIMSLEIRGRNTAVMAAHFQKPSDPLRESKLRFGRCSVNQGKTTNFLPGFELEERSAEGLLNITLAHGDKNAEFAYFRVYNDPFNLRSHLQLSSNLMSKPYGVPSVEAEEVKEASIVLKKSGKIRKIQ
jgi:hypothetical protein